MIFVKCGLLRSSDISKRFKIDCLPDRIALWHLFLLCVAVCLLMRFVQIFSGT